MKRWFKIVMFYWLPVLFVAAMIFTASSQPYEEQDIRPYISQATDVERIKEMYHQIRMEHIEHRLYIEENGFLRTLQVIVERWKILAAFIGVFLVAAVAVLGKLFIKAVKQKGMKRVSRAVGWLALVFVTSGALVLFAALFAFRIETFLLFIKDFLLQGRAQNVLEALSFRYAGSEISVERLGLEGFIEFLIRKGAHFGFFFVLGFLMYRALWASRCKKKTSYIGALVFVLLYAISDEVHQAFTPNRTPLVEDVLLDFSGGFTGATLAVVLYTMFPRKKKQEVIDSTTRMGRRKRKI
ncbi:VanZ family protein [Alkalihalobacillus sp. MEB130]|uniref:VanZ family protein n=1 Tax=Alkalihalobacillus sp. MEB130 TaxID=2976704 RepID=UPI0028DEC320|nr:VanZ family protein [Alkalihalobacillus sp. MEB130]MDT8858701.1 VanZ family protein [Alkalihalobacillus sp. MEB130]